MPSSLFGPVADDLRRVEDEIAAAAEVKFAPLAVLLSHILQPRGKRVRPGLVLLSARFGHYDLDRLVNLAAAIELLHTATLVHDDLIDGAATRRGAATLHSLVSGHASVLVGDYIFAKSAYLCARTESVRVMGVFGETLMAICDGELQQAFAAGNGHMTESEYLEKIRGKTATLFQTATETGAILSGADEATVTALREFGLRIGLAFQVVDDVLDFVGDERTLGKPVGGDLRQGTLTLPALWVLRNMPQEHAVREVLESTNSDDGAVQVAVRAVVDSPAIAYSLGVARRLCDEARIAIADLPDNASRSALHAIADYVVNRTN